MNHVQLSRRELLLAGGVAVTAASLTAGLAGCDASPTDGPPTPVPVEALTPVLLGQQRLLARYAQTLSDFPELTPTLSGLQDQSEAHTAALLVAVPAAAAQIAAAESSSAASTSSVQATEAPEPTPAADAATALSDLARVVDAAAGRLRAAAQREGGELAALLGSCAASTACHAWLLGL